jgi:hypothetical protein
MRGKWAAGIVPRHFTWLIKEQLAVSERLGGYGSNHRRVRRQEEIIWVQNQGFTRIISLLASPHNLHAYDELGVEWQHVPFGGSCDPKAVLGSLYPDLRRQLAAGDKLLLHHEELGDRLSGTMAGYLVYTGMVPEAHKAIAVVEHLVHRQIGPSGRELVAVAETLPQEP